jgi:hypothetical protein
LAPAKESPCCPDLRCIPHGSAVFTIRPSLTTHQL